MSKEAMKLALEAIEFVQADRECSSTNRQAIAALREALAEQPAQQAPKENNGHCSKNALP